MGLLKPFNTIIQHPSYLPTYWRKLRREFRLFDYDYRFLDGYSCAPKSICLILTEACNLKCRMCDIGQKNARNQENSFSHLTETIAAGNDRMRLDDWRMLLDEIARMNGHPLVLLTGTEPFLYPRILDLLEYGITRNLNFHITTNGTLLKNFAEQLVALNSEPDALRITISLDGIGDVHDNVRGVTGTFDRAMEGLAALNAMKKQRKKQWPETTINYTISNYNYLYVRDFIEWFYRNDFQVHGINFSHLWYKDAAIVEKHNKHFAGQFPVQEENTAGVDFAAIDMSCVYEQLAAIREGRKRFPFYVAETPPLTEAEARLYYARPTENVFYDKCLAPWRNIAVNPHGEVIISPLCFVGSLGNVKHNSFSDIWNGTAFRTFRRKLKKVGMYPACSRCCMLFDSKPKYYKIGQML